MYFKLRLIENLLEDTEVDHNSVVHVCMQKERLCHVFVAELILNIFFM